MYGSIVPTNCMLVRWEMRGRLYENGNDLEMKSSVIVFMSDVVGMAARETPRSFVHVIDRKD